MFWLGYGIIRSTFENSYDFSDAAVVGFTKDGVLFKFINNSEEEIVYKLKEYDIYPCSGSKTTILSSLYTLTNSPSISNYTRIKYALIGNKSDERPFYIIIDIYCEQINEIVKSAKNHTALSAILCWISNDQNERLMLNNSNNYSNISSLIHTALNTPPPTIANIYETITHTNQITSYNNADLNLQNTLILPPEVLFRILKYLDIASLRRVTCTCRLLLQLSMEVIPGLQLQLFPHQINSVWWMMGRERNGSTVPNLQWRTLTLHPCIEEITNLDKTTSSSTTTTEKTDTNEQYISVSLVTNQFILGLPPDDRGVRGGFLCDEPGLGKTITLLALM